MDLGCVGNPPDQNSQLLDMIRDMQREMVQLRTRNEQLLQASQEQERLIRELTSRFSHESEDHGKKRKEAETNLEWCECGE